MKEINTAELIEKLAVDNETTLIDVREAEEVALGMIPGSIHIPLGFINEEMSNMEKDTEYIIICRSGGRSHMAAQMMEMNGLDATNYVDGIIDWAGELE